MIKGCFVYEVVRLHLGCASPLASPAIPVIHSLGGPAITTIVSPAPSPDSATPPASDAPKPPAHNPYVPTQRAYQDFLGVVFRENTILRGIILVALAIIAFLLFNNYILATRPPYVGAVVLDQSTKTSRAIKLPSITQTDVQQVYVAFFLPKVVESIFTVTDIDGIKRNFTEDVKPFVHDPSQASIWINSYLTDPTTNPIARAQTERVKVVVDPVPAPKLPNEYVIGWTEIRSTLEGRLIGSTHNLADILVEFSVPTSDNIIGMRLLNITIDRTAPQASTSLPAGAR